MRAAVLLLLFPVAAIGFLAPSHRVAFGVSTTSMAMGDDSFVDNTKDKAGDAKDYVKDKAGNVRDFVKDKAGDVKDFVSGDDNDAKKAGRKAGQKIDDATNDAQKAVDDARENISDAANPDK